MTGAITITLTYPPSANRLWRNVKGKTLKSAEYRAWSDLNRKQAMGARIDTITGPYSLTVLATAPDKRRRDLGNLEKAISDCLQDIGVVSDDCHCRKLSLEWVDGPGAGVTCTVEPYQPEARA